MISLLLSILSSTIILLIFKLMERFKISVFPPIVINYIIATFLGFSISSTTFSSVVSNPPDWIWLCVVIGILLIVNFNFIGLSTRNAGIAVTTVASKMSFVIPVIFSLTYDVNDEITTAKIIQLVLAMVAVFMVVYQDGDKKDVRMHIVFPILIFVGLGVLDSMVKYGQYNYVKDTETSSVFSALNFMIAGIIGVVIAIANRKYLKEIIRFKVIIAGTILGIANFGSMYFLINALNDLHINNSLVFGINNLGVVGASILMAFIFFKERFSKINWIGLSVAVTVLILMIKYFY